MSVGAVVGGTVPLQSAAYVVRPFEASVFENLSGGRWVLLLGPRQHGKSSALVRLYARLEEDGFVCAFVDLQRYGAEETSYAGFLQWVTERVAGEVGADWVYPPDAARDDLQSWLEAALPAEFANVAILIDETSGVPLMFRERFFGQLRALYNDRATSDATSVSNRVVFLFSGTFRPEDLITSDNSPFNVSVLTVPDEFNEDEAVALGVAVLGDGGEEHGRRAFAAVGGQPYMLQVLIGAVERAMSTATPADSEFEAALGTLKNGTDRHVPDLMRLVMRDPPLRALATKLLEESIPYVGTDADHLFAVVSGIARAVDDQLVIRNSLYSDALAALNRRADENTMSEPSSTSYDVVLVTATDVETAAVREVFTGDHPTIHGKNNTYRDLGLYGGARVALVRAPEMGATGSGGSILTVSEAVADLGCRSVLLVGVAFGVDPEKQQIGDVLCATRVVDYEMQRVGTKDGELDVKLRGVAAQTTARVVGRLQNAASDFEGAVAFGPVLSGDKLVDNLAAREALESLVPDVVGGEMEGRGAYAAANREGVDWALVKGICDWADGNKGQDKEMRQKLAATRAAQFVRTVLDLGGFGPAA